ncbi:hypothetical protein GQR58_029795 [Nymphon striatum]|nr:hypothetical protein GQR58_029795 [Nymphon striatum]
MDLLTVTGVGAKVLPANAPFRVLAHGQSLLCFRPSNRGTVYVDRLSLVEQPEERKADGTERDDRSTGKPNFVMEQMWETRFRGSGEKDIPANPRDSQSVFRPDGRPFIEPTIELTSDVRAGEGAFDVTIVPTSDPSVSRVLLASTIEDEVKIWSLTILETGEFDMSELNAPTVIKPLVTLPGGPTALKPLAALAPAVTFYYEQNVVAATDDKAGGRDSASLQDGRVMVAAVVENATAGLDPAVAIYDFGVTAEGRIPSFDAAVPLVDGTVVEQDGKKVFKADNDASGYPTGAQVEDTTFVIGGLVASAMVLGQVRMQRSPLLFSGNDGVIHLYYAGPNAVASQSDGDWGGLVPKDPRFMVAQYNTRSRRTEIDLEWKDATQSEAPVGSVRLVARRSGPSMNTATVTVAPYGKGADGGGASTAPGLCDVHIAYGTADDDMPDEVWSGVPRELSSWLTVMNGASLANSGDPRAKDGSQPYFDAEGSLPQLRLPGSTSPSGEEPGKDDAAPFPAMVTLVSKRPALGLTSATIADGADATTADLALVLSGPDGAVHVNFPGITRTLDQLADVLGGVDPNPPRSDTRTLATFHQAVAVREGEPLQDYTLATTGAKSLQLAAIAPPPPAGQPSFLQTGVDTRLRLDGSFTFELWVQPDAVPTPADGPGFLLKVGEKERTIDDVPMGTFTSTQPVLHVGGTGMTGGSMAGRYASLRYWSAARTIQQIRSFAFRSVPSTATALQGLWTLDAVETQSGQQVFVNSAATGSVLNAVLVPSNQQVNSLVPNQFMLSLVAGVAGSPMQVGSSVLRSDSWNHVAVTHRAGGGLLLTNDQSSDAASAKFDYAIEQRASNFGFSDRAAIDAWVQLAPAGKGLDNTIVARWSSQKDGQDFELSIDENGDLTAAFNISTDLEQTLITARVSGGAELLAPVGDKPGPVRHVAAVIKLTNTTEETDKGADLVGSYDLRLYIDGKTDPAWRATKEQKGRNIQYRLTGSETPLTVGMRQPPLEPWESLEAGDHAYFHGVIGETRIWSTNPDIDTLFPELDKRATRVARPAGLVARWAFRQQEGNVAYEDIRDDNLLISSSDLWTALRETAEQALYANGSRVWNSRPFEGLGYSATEQFTLGNRAEGGAGLSGSMTDVRIWSEQRTPAQISANQYSLLSGDEPNLTGYWNFNDHKGIDQTGGGNNASPVPAAARIVVSDAPVSDEGPEVFNVYGGVDTEFQVTTRTRPAVGDLVAAAVDRDGVATGTLLRQYVYGNPVANLPAPFKVGDLDLTFVGQVQTDAKLIGYIEGAPPVPSENLSLPYWSPTSITHYDGASNVQLTQTGDTAVNFSTNRTSASKVTTKGSVGPFWKFEQGQVYGIGVAWQLKDFTVEGKFLATTQHEFGWGTGSDRSLNASWTDRSTDTLALRGTWEPEDDVSDPTIGRRFVPDNLGYALVESLVADTFAMRDARTGAMLGMILVPNLAIPPDRNIITFPIKDAYTKQGTLDGKIGFRDDRAARDGSYFKPEEAYQLRAEIEQEAARDQAFAKQFDAASRGQTESTSGLAGVSKNLPVDFEADTVRRGLVNSYVWSADGGFHAEEQNFLAKTTTAYKGFFNRVNQGGFDLDSTFAFFIGFKGALSFSGGVRVDVSVSSSEQRSLAFGLTSRVTGESYLHAWRPDVEGGSYTRDPAPGKVRAYRFMTYYEPPSEKNASGFRDIVSPVWLKRSTDAAAVALRSADLGNPAWRVRHRVTYVERVPPTTSGEPLYSDVGVVDAPVNLAGNVALLRMIQAEIGGKPPTPVRIGRALQAILNPPEEDGVWPEPTITAVVPWWNDFVKRARPGPDQDTEATALLSKLFTNALHYFTSAYRSGLVT